MAHDPKIREFYKARTDNDLERAQSLLSHWSDPPDDLLVDAVIAGQPDFVQMLIEYGYDVNAVVYHQHSHSGHAALIHHLVEGLAMTPHWSRREDEYLSCLDLLLRHGADPDGNMVDRPGVTLTSYAAGRRMLGVMNVYLARGADPDAGDLPALGQAAESGSLEIAALLLDHGADPNLVSKYGNTPLMVAARSDVPEVVELLLEGGVDLARHQQGEIASNLAAKAGALTVFEHLQVAGVAGEEALDWKAVLHRGAEAGKVEYIERALAVGVSVNPRGSTRPPLFTAVGSGSVGAVQSLVDGGADCAATYWESKCPGDDGPSKWSVSVLDCVRGGTEESREQIRAVVMGALKQKTKRKRQKRAKKTPSP